MTTVEYAILEAAFGPQQLAKMVNNAAKDGWMPLGSPFVIPLSHSDYHDGGCHDIATAICQAMIRPGSM